MDILLFIVILLLLVVVHELGHFLVAKRADIRVDEFAFGFPPRIFSRKKGETTYAFNWLPIGGYVKIFGENPADVPEDHPDRMRSFAAKSRIIQAAVVAAGVVFNLLLAWILVYGALLAGISASVSALPEGTKVSDPKLYIVDVLPGSPAEEAGLKAGDRIVELRSPLGSLEGGQPGGSAPATEFIARHDGTDLALIVEQGGAEREIALRPERGVNASSTETPAIGVYLETVGTLRYGPLAAVAESVKMTAQYTMLTAVGIGDFFLGILSGAGDFSQVTGPVGIVQVVGEAASLGAAPVLILTALISINLAVINLIPFPALDGGRLLFIAIESATRRAIPARIQQWANMAGFGLLLLLMLLVTYHDIARLIR